MELSRSRSWAPVLLAGALALSACGGDVTPDADGNYVGTVTQVREDSLRMDVDSGGDMRVDTFGVCGDATATFISVGDRLTITANREVTDFDATAILNEEGQPACEANSAPSQEGDAGESAAGEGEEGDATDTTAGDQSGSSTVTQQEAEDIALESVGEGRVTFSGPEDDRGAAWEVEITRDDGSEVDVLVDAEGNVIP